MKTQFFLILSTFFFSTTFFAQPRTAAPAQLLHPKDSLWLTVDSNSTKVIYHPVKSGQTLYSICKFYSISIPEVYAYNPNFQTNPTLFVGQRVRIPVPNIAIKRYRTKNFVGSQNVPIYYKVQPGETLYAICKRYFNMPVDTIRQRNRLKTDQIVPGQLIFVAWMGIEGIPEVWRKRTANPTAVEHRLAFEQQTSNFKEYQVQGVCFWQKNSDEIGELYALHREAVLHSTISVFNPMTNKNVYAKVIGRIPGSYDKSVEVILSPAAARQLGARDAKFFAKIRYFK